MGQKLFVILINTVKSLKGWFRQIDPIHQGIHRRPVFGQTIYNESPWAKEEQLSQKTQIRNTVWSDRGGFPHSAAAYLARAALGPRVPDKQLQQGERQQKFKWVIAADRCGGWLGLKRVPVVRLYLNYSTGSASQMVIFCLGLQLKRVERGLERCKFYFSFSTNTGIGKESLYTPDKHFNGMFGLVDTFADTVR